MLKKTVVFLSSLWLLAESGYGLLQIAGRRVSGHALFAMTGHFSNPGPFGGFIAVLMAVCGAYCLLHREDKGIGRWIVYLSLAAFAGGFLVLPASMSRAAWLGLAVAAMILLLRERIFRNVFKNRPWLVAAVAATALALCTGGFLLKKESALGRLHIWRIESRIIARNPLTGTGPGKLAFSYGEEQARFFSEKKRAPETVRIAGCPEYAFNEYLHAGVTFGLAGLLASIALAVLVCTILVRKDNPLGYGAVVLAVFAFFSYPLNLWQFRLLAGLFLAAAAGELLGKRDWMAYAAFAVAVAAIYAGNGRTSSSPGYRELYNQGHLLFEAGRYDEALPLLEEGASLSCDPMFHNIIGRCHEALGDAETAQKEYIHSHYMVPGRIYPLVLLQELYLSQGDTAKASAMLSAIREIPINEKNRNMAELKERAEKNHPRDLSPQYGLPITSTD